jgi:hypothetical protein
MIRFYRHPDGALISRHSVVAESDVLTVAIRAAGDIVVVSDADDLMVLRSGTTIDGLSLWTVSVKPSVRRNRRAVEANIFANTLQWQTVDSFRVVFPVHSETEPAFKVSRLTKPGLKTTVDAREWAPIYPSLASDRVFGWTSVAGKGRIQYFQLFEHVTPNWFGVVVPVGIHAPNDVLLFFHPTPGRAGYRDEDYKSKAGWDSLFHYLSDPMAAQFCAAGTGQILVMPLMSDESSTTCGILPQHWESILSQILGFVTAGDESQVAAQRPVESVVVASFCTGIRYSASFRKTAQLGKRLRGVIDFDSIVSSGHDHPHTLAATDHPVMRMQQMSFDDKLLPAHAQQGLYPLLPEGPQNDSMDDDVCRR